MRLDAKEALDQIRATAEREATGAARKATSALEAKRKVARNTDKKVAARELDSAIDKLVNGEGTTAASASINAAAEAMNSKGAKETVTQTMPKATVAQQRDLAEESVLLEQLTDAAPPDAPANAPPSALRSTDEGGVAVEDILRW